MEIATRNISNRNIVWFETSNKYVWMEEPAYEVFELLRENVLKGRIAKGFSEKYGLSSVDGLNFVTEVESLINKNSVRPDDASSKDLSNIDIPFSGKPTSEKIYYFNGVSLCFKYYHRKLEEMFHPKMAHLEKDTLSERFHEFHLLRVEDKLYIRTDDKLIGQWGMDEIHYFQGKVSAEFINKVYDKDEKDWIGGFHASALSDGKNCIIMPGDSGSGKSTSLAILMASGFSVVADDFVPIEAETAHVRLFPAAISIKQGAWDMVKKVFPDFGNNGDVYNKNANTKMIYLPPAIHANPKQTSAPVKAIVFINYSQGSDTKLEEYPKDIAFQKLVTDSWISPIYENVERFLDWFLDLPCYKLTYSDNKQMVSTIGKLFRDES